MGFPKSGHGWRGQLKIAGELSQVTVHPEAGVANMQLKPADVGRMGSSLNVNLFLNLVHQFPSLGFQPTDSHCCESFKARVSLVTPATSSCKCPVLAVKKVVVEEACQVSGSAWTGLFSE